MDSSNKEELPFPSDEWEEKLQIKLKELQSCQKEKNLSSCLKCKDILDCDLRNQYINAVYSSMNKGSGGGFEF